MWSVIFFAIILPGQIYGSGLFQLRLKKFINENGKDNYGTCCSKLMDHTGNCIGECNTRFIVYLKPYQAIIDISSKDNYGALATTVLGHNIVDLTTQSAHQSGYPLDFHFEFAWPESFTLLIEAWHNSTNRKLSPGVLISRSALQGISAVSEKWTEYETESDQSVLQYSFRVKCDSNYYGARCTILCRPRDDIFGHYICSSIGERVCLEGWEGDYCDKVHCLPGCDEQHGYCTKANDCRCRPGWKGTLCDECEVYPGCVHGTCQTKWECICNEGWGGLLCNQDLNYCINHRPCQNNGTCHNAVQGAYTCNCLPGFQGKDCEIVISDCNHFSCLNGGNCKDTGFGFMCQCPNGYNGVICERHTDECASNPCDNGGSCTSKDGTFTCSCPSGFTGQICEKNIDDCQGNPCLNGGTCVDMINQFQCKCVSGFIGTYCAYKPNLCLTKPCENGGTCINLMNDYRCSCGPGLTGKDCSVRLNKCISNPCKHGATCINAVNGFKCVCPKEIDYVECESESSNLTHNESVNEPNKESYIFQHIFFIISSLFVILKGAIYVLYIKNVQKAVKEEDTESMQHSANAGLTLDSSKLIVIRNLWDKNVNNVPLSADGVDEPSNGQLNDFSINDEKSTNKKMNNK